MSNLPQRFLSSTAIACAIALALFSSGVTHAQTPSAATAKDETFVVEYYYKVKWGFADEFIRLFRKNHFPVLKEEMKQGRIVQVTAVAPRYHGTEDGRWDYRVTIVYKNVAAAFTPPPAAENEAMLKRIFPDQETFKREEQRRFEILLAHWDVPVTPVNPER